MKLLAAFLLCGCFLEQDDMARETTVLALGQITQPNEMGQYPAGALKVATNVFIRSPGVVAQSRQAQTLYDTSEAGIISQALIPADNSVLGLYYIAGVTYAGWWNGSTFNANAIIETFPNDGRVTWTRSRDRIFVPSNNGLIAFDHIDPVSLAERTPRYAAIPAPVLLMDNPGTIPGGALKANTHASVVAVVSRVFPDGYEILSAVSDVDDTGAYGGDTDIGVVVRLSAFGANKGVVAGDVIRIFRTRAQALSSATLIGGTSCDATFYQTASHVVTAGEVAGGLAFFVDSIPDTGFGEQLYSNPGIGGAQATRISPPAAQIACTFKGHSMLFGLTEAAQKRLAVLGGFGYAQLADGVAWRNQIIGERDISGTATVGSPVFAAISATHMVGLKVGQSFVAPARWPATVFKIIAVGANSVTVNANATSSGAATAGVNDQLLVNGADIRISGQNGQAPSLSWAALILAQAAATADLVIQYASVAYFSSTFLTAPSPSAGFSIAKMRAIPDAASGFASSFTIAATNGKNYTPPLPEYNSGTTETVSPVAIPNGWAWSEAQLPDAWPPANRSHIGSGTLLGAVPTRDAVWVFATDGLWRLSGNGGAVGAEGYDWRVDPVDSTLVLAGPWAACVMRDTVYAYTNRGLVAVSDEQGVKELTDGVIGDLLPGADYAATSFIKVVADLDKDEIWVVIDNTARVWSYRTKTWVRNTELVGTTKFATYAWWAKKNSLIMNDDTTGLVRFFDETYACWAEAQIRYQPLYFGDAFATKQWIDETWSFDPSNGDDTNAIAVNFNGGAYTADALPAVNSTDARVTFMIPRDAPALGQTIAPGMKWAASVDAPNQPKLWGLSMRATVIGDQQTRRSQ